MSRNYFVQMKSAFIVSSQTPLTVDWLQLMYIHKIRTAYKITFRSAALKHLYFIYLVNHFTLINSLPKILVGLSA